MTYYQPWPRPAAGPPMAPDAAAPKAPVKVVNKHTGCFELKFVVDYITDAGTQVSTPDLKVVLYHIMMLSLAGHIE